jgi:ATP-binding cassette subfamily B protein
VSQALEAMHEEEALGKAYDLRLMARLWRWVLPYRLQVGATLALVLPITLVELAPAWIIKTALDGILLGGGESVAPDWLDRLLLGPGWVAPLSWLSSLFLLVMLLGPVLQFVDGYLMSRTGQEAMRDLRRDVFAHIQKLHLGFFDRYPVGRLVTRCTNDVENVAEMFTSGIVLLFSDVVKMVVLVVVLFQVDAQLALYSFLVIPPLAACAVVFRFKVREAFRRVRVRIARINAYIQENVTGMREVQLFTREARNFREFDGMNADHRDAWKQSIHYDAALFAVVELAQNLTLAIILWHASGLASAGTIYVFIDYLRRFFLPLRDLSARYSVMQSSMASCERIFQLLDTASAVSDRPGALAHGALPREQARGVVEFEDVWFAYSGDRGEATDWVLRGVSFRVEAGEKVALVGPTGAGKTTVLKLLTRLYEPTRGRILLDGRDLRDLTQEHVRRRVAMVLQDVFLFSGTVAENLALDRSDIDRARIVEVARAVQAERFVERLPEGFDTPVRERGSNFSAGQRQLLSFARALAHGADVLALDEATSSIDPETEALVQRGIHALMQGRTALVVAHRLSTIQDVDRIYVLDHGRIAEAGTHAELLALGGLYERLYYLQYEAQPRAPMAAFGS